LVMNGKTAGRANPLPGGKDSKITVRTLNDRRFRFHDGSRRLKYALYDPVVIAALGERNILPRHRGEI
jgi:hypothetical protein